MELELGPSWMDPIVTFLKNGMLLEDKREAHKIRLKAARFWLSPEGKLYKKSYSPAQFLRMTLLKLTQL